MTQAPHRDFVLEPEDVERLANLAGPFDEHLRQLELRLGVEIANRGHVFRVTGNPKAADTAERVLRSLYEEAAGETLDSHKIHARLGAANLDHIAAGEVEPQEVAIRVKRGTVRGRGANQAKYLHAIATHDISFGIGPAGTGKTFLAVAMAVEALNESRVQRLLLVRPAVEAGEKLGFLPGDLSQVDLPKHQKSGLRDAIDVLRGVDGISFTFFTAHDVVRHPLVARIVRAYDARDGKESQE